MHIVILAGGGGLRLWPLSREDFPKQFLHFGNRDSLLQQTLRRFLSAPFAETISVSSNAQYASLIRQQVAKIDPEQKTHIIVEPARRNTAPAIAFSLRYLQETIKIPEESLILVLPSDHLLEPEDVFFRALEQVIPLLKKDYLVLFGIRPTKPETGYGYISVKEPFDSSTYSVKRFIEKPSRADAERLLASEGAYWNSGIFAFSLSFFWEQAALHCPEILAKKPYEAMPNISFDYALLEKMERLLLYPLPVRWSDIGCWDSVYDMMAKDQNQNAKLGNVLDIDTKNSLLFSSRRLLSTIGLEDLLIVETEDATFISKKGESQKVKALVQELMQMRIREGESRSLQHCPWGTLQILDVGEGYTLQKISIEPGQIWECAGSGILILLSGTARIEERTLPLFTPCNMPKERVENPSSQKAVLLFCHLAPLS